MTITGALMAAGGSAVYLQIMTTRSAGMVVGNTSSLYCAEAGLVMTQQEIASRYQEWGAMLDPNTPNPAGYPFTGDIDGDGVADWSVIIVDNDDEPGTNNPNVDNDLTVFVVSSCTQNQDIPAKLMQLVQRTGGANSYRSQGGQGAGNSGNAN